MTREKNTVEISVVMPAMNERASIGATVRDVASALDGERFEIVVVDDGSDDGTWDEILRLSEEDPRVGGLKLTRNFGHQAALHAGMRAARGAAVITMDSDGEHPPALLSTLVERWRGGARIVQGLRDDTGTAMPKRVTSRAYYRLFSWLAGTDMRPGSADFRLLDRGVVEVILAHPNAGAFLRGFVPWTGFDTEYVEYSPGKRTAGKTKFSSNRMFGLARQGILRFSVKPLRISMLIGGLTCIASLCYLVYILFMRIFHGDVTVAGWASVAGLLSLMGGVQLMVIGILGEYVGIIFETLRGQPMYIIDRRCGEE